MRQALGVYRVRSYTIQNLEARRIRDVVVVHMIFDIEARVGQVDRSRRFFITDVWVQCDATWKVAARYSSLPEETSESSRAVTDTDA